jgi:hypothetical protein
MPISRTQVKQLVRQALLRDATVAASLGQAIHTEFPRTADYTSIPMPCAIIDVLGGRGGYEGGHDVMVCEIYVYSRESQEQADTIYDQVYAALQAVRLYDGTASNGSRVITAAGYARETRRPDSGYNAEVGAWYARGQWTTHTAG